MSKPIILGKEMSIIQDDKKQSQRRRQLQRMLETNLKIQNTLKTIRDNIKERMNAIEIYISTYRLKTEYPQSSALLSYLKFECTQSNNLKQQAMIQRPSETIPDTEEDFIKRLAAGKKVIKAKKEGINFTQLPNNPKEINFIELAKQYGYISGVQVYQKWLENKQKTVKKYKRPYSHQQESKLIQRNNIYGDNWEKICQQFQNRTFEENYYQFHNRINPKIVGGRWTPRQSLMLIILLQHYGTKRWAMIAQKIVVKSELQVRQRFCNIIDPNIGKDAYWTRQMQNTLLEIAPEFNYCWKNIAKIPIFCNKTDNCVWRKFRALMIKKSSQEIKQQIPDSTTRGLATKLLKFKELYDSRGRKRVVDNQKIGTFDPNQQARIHRSTMSASALPIDFQKDIPEQHLPQSNQNIILKQYIEQNSEQPSYILYP